MSSCNFFALGGAQMELRRYLGEALPVSTAWNVECNADGGTLLPAAENVLYRMLLEEGSLLGRGMSLIDPE